MSNTRLSRIYAAYLSNKPLIDALSRRFVGASFYDKIIEYTDISANLAGGICNHVFNQRI